MLHTRAERTFHPGPRTTPAAALSSARASVGNLALARSLRRDAFERHADFVEAPAAQRAAESERVEEADLACVDTGARPLLSIGTAGPSVATLQCRLNTVDATSVTQGLDPIADAPLVVDAVFGERTRAAVLSFQQRAFPVTPAEWDGVVGPKTWAALDAAAAGERPAAFCRRPGAPAHTALASFAGGDGLPGGDLVPCGPTASGGPPPFKEVIVNVFGPVTAEATTRVNPHLHLGMTKRHDPKGIGAPGAQFQGAVQDGGPATGGEIFFSQVIRSSLRKIRVGTDLSEEKIADMLDGGAQFGMSRMPVGPGRNPPVTDGDPPGTGLNAQRPKSRYTIKISDEFELFLMWRPSVSSPTSDWLTYGSVKWSWEGIATGVSTDSALTWLSPIEEFKVCDASRAFAARMGIAKGASGKPQAPSHLGLPINSPGNLPLSLKPTFTDPVAREPGLDDC